MAKIKAPLFSLDASGSLDKTITYRNKPRDNTASKYAKPGDKNPFESSPRQKDQRSIIGLITACWQSKTNLDKLSWDASAKAARFKGSGYHYFLHLAKTDLKTYLGLVGFWSMNYSNGDSVPDLSGNGNHGILSPIYPCDCPQPVDSNNKKNGKAMLFDGVDDYIFLGLLNDVSLLPSITYLALINCNLVLTHNSMIINKEGCVRIIIDDSSGRPLFTCATDNNSWYNKTVTGTTNIKGIGWCIIACVYNGSSLKIYLNSILENTTFGISGNTVSNGNNFRIGISSSSTFPNNGSIDNLIIFNRALLPKEIQRLYTLLI